MTEKTEDQRQVLLRMTAEQKQRIEDLRRAFEARHRTRVSANAITVALLDFALARGAQFLDGDKGGVK